MLTVPEAARYAGKNPETVRRWIREGKLHARKFGNQHVIDEDDLADTLRIAGVAPQPESLRAGRPASDVSDLIHDARAQRTARLLETVAPYLTQSGPASAPGHEDWLPAIVGRIVRLVDPMQISLFGSRALGSARADSDYDLLVVLDEVPDRRDTRIRIRRALADLPVSLEVIVAGSSEISEDRRGPRGIVQWAADGGRVVYERP